MSRYTPGPWVTGNRPAQLISTNHRVVALVIGEDDDNMRANAALVKAAPELLEALRDARALLVKACGSSQIGFPSIDAAICAATGEKP
jgi:hypothetical protein